MLRVRQSQKAGTPQIPITCAPSARGKSAQPQTGTEALVRATTRVNPEDAVPSDGGRARRPRAAGSVTGERGRGKSADRSVSVCSGLGGRWAGRRVRAHALKLTVVMVTRTCE